MTAALRSGTGVADPAVLPLRGRSRLVLGLASAVGVLAYGWPFLTRAEGAAELAHASDAPWVFVALVPLLLAVVALEVADGRLDAKAVALLGVLVACGAALRLPTAGVTGVSAIFVLVIPAARVLGAGFGFVLGALTMLASALITGGVGPWLPFQMLALAWVGLGAGCLPRATGRAEVALLAAYGAAAGFAYGAITNLWFWPFGSSAGSSAAYLPGAGALENLERYARFYVTTSLGWDLTRAVGNLLMVAVAATPVLVALRRACRRAAFAPGPP